MSSSPGRKPLALLIMIARALDGIAIGTLVWTGELNPQWGLILSALAITAYLFRDRKFLSQPFLIFLMLSVVVGSVAIWPKFRLHPLIVASHSAPLIHALVWFGGRTFGQFGSRLALGFLEIALAAAISPELFVAAGIFGYFIGASLLLICLHLWSERLEYAPDQLEAPIPRRVIGFSLIASLLVLGASVMIFPFLPRLQSPWSSQFGGGIGTGGRESEIGYRERATLDGTLSWARDGGGRGQEPVLRIFIPTQAESPNLVDWKASFPMGLLRMRVLPVWKEGQFVADGRTDTRTGMHAGPTEAAAGLIRYSAIREPLATESLPAPYGTARLLSPATVSPQSEGLYRSRGIENRRVQFNFDVPPLAIPLLGSGAAEPSTRDTFIPPTGVISDRARWEQLAQALARGVNDNTRNRLARIRDYFTAVGFKAGQADVQQDSRPVLERFMFEMRTGHCEWFAMSSLVLLRLQGVPARLVSGFRISSPPWGAVLTVRQKDSHLWLEAWDQKIGRWIPFDPTPRVAAQPGIIDSLLDSFRDSRSWASSVWYRWILSPGTDPESLLESRGGASSFASFGRALRWKNLPASSEAWRQAAQLYSRRILESMGPWSKGVFSLALLLGLGKALAAWRALHWSRRDPAVFLARLANAPARILRAPIPRLDRQWTDTLLELRFSGMEAHSPERRRALASLWQVVRDYWLGSV